MIRHASLGASAAVSALSIQMIEPPFFRSLVTTIGGAMAQTASKFPAGDAAVDLAAFTGRADEENNAAARRKTRALPVGGGAGFWHVGSRTG